MQKRYEHSLAILDEANLSGALAEAAAAQHDAVLAVSIFSDDFTTIRQQNMHKNHNNIPDQTLVGTARAARARALAKSSRFRRRRSRHLQETLCIVRTSCQQYFEKAYVSHGHAHSERANGQHNNAESCRRGLASHTRT